MEDLQPLLPRKIPQSVFPPIAPDLGSLPAMTTPASTALGTIAPPALANITDNPRMVANSSDPLINRTSALEADIYKRENPIKPTTTLGKIGHVAANVGNVLGDIFAPGVMSAIPGTQLGNERIEGLDQSKIADVSKQQTEEAARGQTAAQTGLTNAETQLLPAKTLATLNGKLVTKGFKPATLSPDGELQVEEDPDSQAFKDRVALSNLRDMQAQRAQVLASTETPEFKNRELAQIDARIGLASRSLGLRGAELGLHRDAYNERAFGTDSQGNPLPGSLVLPTGQSVGTGNAENVRPTTDQRNAAGRADVMQLMGQHIAEEMQDPDVAPYLGAGAGRIAELEGKGGVLPEKVARLRNDLVSYGAFQAGLHPVRGIGALEYFDKVMGGLGQNPEQLRGKLLSNADTAALAQGEGSPSIATGGKNSRTISPRTGASGEVSIGTTTKPDGVYEMNGKHYRVQGGKVYAH